MTRAAFPSWGGGGRGKEREICCGASLASPVQVDCSDVTPGWRIYLVRPHLHQVYSNDLYKYMLAFFHHQRGQRAAGFSSLSSFELSAHFQNKQAEPKPVMRQALFSRGFKRLCSECPLCFLCCPLRSTSVMGAFGGLL